MNRRTETAITFIIMVLSIGVAAAAIKTAVNYNRPTTTAQTTEAETTTRATTGTTEATSTTVADTEYHPETEAQEMADLKRTEAFYLDDDEPVYITAEEYYTICGIVMNEAGAYYGTYEGRIAVAQSIRNQIIREKHKGNAYDIVTIRNTYGLHYTKKPSDEVRQAVTDVFFNHIVVTEEPILAWCATGQPSAWHSTQVLVCTHGGNDFYKLAEKDW